MWGAAVKRGYKTRNENHRRNSMTDEVRKSSLNAGMTYFD